MKNTIWSSGVVGNKSPPHEKSVHTVQYSITDIKIVKHYPIKKVEKGGEGGILVFKNNIYGNKQSPSKGLTARAAMNSLGE